jgi:hypothetical protein
MAREERAEAEAEAEAEQGSDGEERSREGQSCERARGEATAEKQPHSALVPVLTPSRAALCALRGSEGGAGCRGRVCDRGFL